MFKLLLVDDQPTVLELLELALGGEYETKTASDGLEALNTARAWLPDGVLTDHWMPGMTGLDLARELARFSPMPKMILLSAGLTPEVAEEAKQIGFAVSLTKPFDLEEMRALVRHVLTGA